MTSSNGNIFRVTGPLCGEFTGPDWANNREAGELRRHRGHYDVIVMGEWIAKRGEGVGGEEMAKSGEREREGMGGGGGERGRCGYGRESG